MTFLRTLFLAAIAVSACAVNGYAGGYYPNQTHYQGYGNGRYTYVDDDSRWFRPEKGVICDRAANICYNKRGPSYENSKQYFGKHDAKKAFNRLEDQDVLFSPRHGVTCDRNRGICYDSNGVDGDLSRRYFGSQPGASRLLPQND
jgi:hypothetical protein